MAVASELASPEVLTAAAGAPCGRFDPFRVLAPRERTQQLDAYREFLRRRDGEMDFEARWLSRREPFMARLAEHPVLCEEGLDVDAFYQHLHRVGAPDLDERTIWALAIAISNQSESYGVEGEIQKWLARGYRDADPIALYHLVEERYHSRMLIEACRTSGLRNLRLKLPRRTHRTMIRIMHGFPDQLRYIPIYCGEVLGCVVFPMLRERCSLFEAEPEVAQRLRSLVSEIELDETGHVIYFRALLRPWALRIAQHLMPLITRLFMRDVPQIGALGLDPDELLRRLRAGVAIPPPMAWLAPDLPAA